eukprot:g1606.t1 g1606   contig10:2426079-2427566(+)
MAKINKQSMKGNDGKARRQQLSQKILIVISAFASFLFVLHILGISPRSGGGINRGGGIRLSKEARLEALRRIGQGKGGRQPGESSSKQQHHGHGHEHNGGVKGLLSMREALTDPNYDPIAKKQAQHILAASTNLIDLEMPHHSSIKDNSYEGIIGVFCTLNFAAQKENPPELPMFRDVVANSNCDDKNHNQRIRVDLNTAVELAREFDLDVAKENLSGPSVLELKGVVFHESRCGSTLAANSMMALDPEHHRVYSESSPPIAAIRGCGEDFSDCSVEGSANLLKDVIYLMARSDDPKETNLFFKFQSAATRTMQSFRMAFPTTPWIFLYRDPVQVMMSQLDMPRISRANCVRSKNSSPMVHTFIKREGYQKDDLEDEEFCAIHLATLCESALENLEDANGVGMAVNYSPDLVHDFLDTVFPHHFNTPVDQAGRDRVLKVSGTYSKNRGQEAEGEFKPDSEKKEKHASKAIRDASTNFLQPPYDALGDSSFNIKNM